MDLFRNELFAEIVLPLPLEKVFHYIVPESMHSKIQPGMRVEVLFGRNQMTGYIMSLVTESNVTGLKELKNVLDAEPVVTDELLSLAKWLSKNYLCSIGEALAAIIPSGIKAPIRHKQIEIKQNNESLIAANITKHKLTRSQQEAVNAIIAGINSNFFSPFLLHGVTGSGKTEIYLSAAESALKNNRSVIFLLPEISLTPQFTSIVKKRFPGIVGLWHSKLSPGEKYRIWDAASRGIIKIILGARSAVFAPFKNLGLIILDEEHEPTYKQEQKPAYQTRDVVLERARINNAAAVLGSATPSLDIYFRAIRNELKLIEITERIDFKPLPEVKLINPSAFHKKSRVISQPLAEAITKILARREQAIIFLNRRGFSPGVICENCGEVWQCPHCSVSLVYHRDPENLRCHYCDYKLPWPGICPSCKKKEIKVCGVGTQQVEVELKKIFPQAKVFRLDRDTASKKGVYEKAYEGFKQEDFDILIGTQMVAKGFDFPRVTLVGVIDADTALYLPDFRAAERTFQLITQVAGRSGRGKLPGEVIVQTRHPEHYALIAAQKHNYKSFYEQEIIFRNQLKYPPFCRLVNLLIRSKKEEKVEEASKQIYQNILKLREQKKWSIDILGPSPAGRLKLYDYFRWQIILKGEFDTMLHIANEIKQFILPSGVLFSIDVDPIDTL